MLFGLELMGLWFCMSWGMLHKVRWFLIGCVMALVFLVVMDAFVCLMICV